MPTLHSPTDSSVLQAVKTFGGVPFVGSAGMFGGVFGRRSVFVIHRGRGKRWELIRESDGVEVETLYVIDKAALSELVLAWLKP
jgi:hypothetical protein